MTWNVYSVTTLLPMPVEGEIQLLEPWNKILVTPNEDWAGPRNHQ